jgi:hypothetical protein
MSYIWLDSARPIMVYCRLARLVSSHSSPDTMTPLIGVTLQIKWRHSYMEY